MLAAAAAAAASAEENGNAAIGDENAMDGQFLDEGAESEALDNDDVILDAD